MQRIRFLRDWSVMGMGYRCVVSNRHWLREPKRSFREDIQGWLKRFHAGKRAIEQHLESRDVHASNCDGIRTEVLRRQGD